MSDVAPLILYEDSITLIECNSGTTQNFLFAVRTTVELQNITTTSQNIVTLLSQITPR